MVWLVGTSTPPTQHVLRGFDRASLSRNQEAKRAIATPQLLASRRTRQHIQKEQQTLTHTGQASTDPWSDPAKGPWNSFLGAVKPSAPTSLSTAGSKRIEQLSDQLRSELNMNLKQEVANLHGNANPDLSTFQPQQQQADKRLAVLETHVSEIKHQHTKFEQWFGEVKQQASHTDERLNQFQSALHQQKGELTQLSTDVHANTEQLTHSMLTNLRSEFSAKLTNRFDKLEAMLSKRHKTERGLDPRLTSAALQPAAPGSNPLVNVHIHRSGKPSPLALLFQHSRSHPGF